MYVSRQKCPLHLPVGVGPFLDPRAVEDARVKVGQTFLSALLVFTQHFRSTPPLLAGEGAGGRGPPPERHTEERLVPPL